MKDLPLICSFGFDEPPGHPVTLEAAELVRGEPATEAVMEMKVTGDECVYIPRVCPGETGDRGGDCSSLEVSDMLGCAGCAGRGVVADQLVVRCVQEVGVKSDEGVLACFKGPDHAGVVFPAELEV